MNFSPFKCYIVLLALSIMIATNAKAQDNINAETNEFADQYNDGVAAQQEELSEVEVIDLNEINLKEAQESWENVQKPTATDVTGSVRIDEILEPSGDYRYSSFGKPDPFQKPSLESASPVRSTAENNAIINGSEIPIVSPLQAYPLDELEVKGVWVLRGGETRAIIMTPKKEGIVVKVGDPIAAGKILSIKRNQLLVRQYRLREDGVREFEDLELSFGNVKEQQRGIIRLDPGKDPEFVKFDEERGQEAQQQQAPVIEAEPVPGEAVLPAIELQ
ncbi:MAG: pilus assembly protein PilP [Oligoflexus sp.]